MLFISSTDFGVVESSASRQDTIRENLDFFSQCEYIIKECIQKQTWKQSAVKNKFSIANHIFAANGKDIQLIINTHVEASKIGRQIAEQVIDFQRRSGESSSRSSPDPDPESSLSLPIPRAEVHISKINTCVYIILINT